MSWLVVVTIALSLSACLNVFMIWYMVKLLRELVTVSSTVEEAFSDIDAFVSHLNGVHELEMFYGDETLGNLLSHSAMLKEEINKYKLSFSLIEETKEIEDNDKDPFSTAP